MGNVQMEASMIRYGSGTVKTALDNGGGGGSAKTLASLTDTNITSPSNGQVLTYDGTAEKWENSTPATPSLAGLSDTVVTEPSNGQVLTYNSTSGKWENASGGGGGGGDYTAYAFEDKTPTGTNYEDYATITLPAGTYHVIAGVYNGSTVYPTTGIKILDGTVLCCVNEGTGLNHPCCMGIFSQTASKEYKVQIRGNGAGGATSGYYLVKKLADAPAVNNNR